MSHFGNVPAQSLVDAVEKHVAKMDEAQLASLLSARVAEMPVESRTALVESIFDAFRDRGESSEDAAEGASTTLDRIENGDAVAIDALIGYGRENTGLLKEALCLFAEHHAAHLGALPPTLVDGIAGRLAQS
jgi:hypothetical protein